MSNEQPPRETDSGQGGKSRDSLVGQTLDGRYRIEEVLGSGGMSVVYKATQLRVNRLVAVKTLKVSVDDPPVYKERFEREISSLCALSHPNIVTVYDSVMGPNELPCVVMDYLRGKSLESLIKDDGPIPIERFARIVVQICSALEHAHRKGIVHRDLKPGNIVLMDDETDFVKVVDFGLARLGQDNRKLTHTGELWGSPPYMSPEQCKSEPVDSRSDIYSLGVVMYEMLTGKDPFFDATSIFDFIQRHVNTPAPPMIEMNVRVNVPRQLEDVVAKVMAKRPEDRYQSAVEVQDAIIEACSGQIPRESREYLSHLANQTRARTPSGGSNVSYAPAPAPAAAAEDYFARAMNPMAGLSGAFNTQGELKPQEQPAVQEIRNSGNQNSGNQARPTQSGEMSNSGNVPVPPAPHVVPAHLQSSISGLRGAQASQGAFSPAVIAVVIGVLIAILGGAGLFVVLRATQQPATQPPAVATPAPTPAPAPTAPVEKQQEASAPAPAATPPVVPEIRKEIRRAAVLHRIIKAKEQAAPKPVAPKPKQSGVQKPWADLENMRPGSK